MNDISWLIYWADVLPSVASFLGIITFLLMIASAVCLVIYWASSKDASDYRSYKEKVLAWQAAGSPAGGKPYYFSSDHEAFQLNEVMKQSRWIFPLCLVVCTLTSFVPSRETFFLIAGSEIGEQAVKTEEFEKVRKVLNKYLDEELNKEKEESK